jgi:hypothetical protein
VSVSVLLLDHLGGYKMTGSPPRLPFFGFLISAVLASGIGGCEPQAAASDEVGEPSSPHLVGPSPIEAGRYLVIIGGCNDCHTDGYMQTEGEVPEELWLTGSPVGWRGPWGTTYAPNLRLTVSEVSESDWVAILKERKALPPMPWMNLNQISESDARLLYQYIRSLGLAGERMPSPLPPDEEPTTPYVSLAPILPSG